MIEIYRDDWRAVFLKITLCRNAEHLGLNTGDSRADQETVHSAMDSFNDSLYTYYGASADDSDGNFSHWNGGKHSRDFAASGRFFVADAYLAQRESVEGDDLTPNFDQPLSEDNAAWIDSARLNQNMGHSLASAISRAIERANVILQICDDAIARHEEERASDEAEDAAAEQAQDEIQRLRALLLEVPELAALIAGHSGDGRHQLAGIALNKFMSRVGSEAELRSLRMKAAE